MTAGLAKVWRVGLSAQARSDAVSGCTAPHLDFRQSGWGDSNSRPLDPQSF
jgi:hypothetical protein